jgi:hypothetical protein
MVLNPSQVSKTRAATSTSSASDISALSRSPAWPGSNATFAGPESRPFSSSNDHWPSWVEGQVIAPERMTNHSSSMCAQT